MIVSNPQGSFVSGISMAASTGTGRVIDLASSNERVPTNWKPVLFNKVSAAGRDFFQFRRPINDSHFRLEIFPGITEWSGVGLALNFESPVSLGSIKDALAKKTIIFLGCARDCLASAGKSIDVLEGLGSFFLDFRIVVFENDSSDGTSGYLKELQDAGRLVLIQRENLINEIPERTVRLGYCRNQLLEYAKSVDFDYACVADLDGVVGNSFKEEGFFSNFEYESVWDAVFPINSGIYYDIWALRHASICPYDYERAMNLVPASLGAQNTLDLYLHHRQRLDFSRLSAWLSVDSAFGGMGLYKMPAIKFASYFGSRGGYQICEHTVLHEKMKSLGASLYINPKFVVDGI
jgi:hypothetical protein